MDHYFKMNDIPDLKFTTEQTELNDIVKKADKNLKSEVLKVHEKRRSQLIVIGSSSESMKSCDFGSATLSSISNSAHGNSSNYCTEDSASTNQELNPTMIDDVEISLANISEELLCISSNSSNILLHSKSFSRNSLHKTDDDKKLTSLDKNQKENLENTFSSSISERLLSLNAQKVMEALEIENLKCKPTLFTDTNRMSVLDMEMLNDCLTSSSLKVSNNNLNKTNPLSGDSNNLMGREESRTPSQMKAAARLAFIRNQINKTLSEEHGNLTSLDKSINLNGLESNVSSSFDEEFLFRNAKKVLDALENDYSSSNTITNIEANKTSVLDLEMLDDSLINVPLKDSSSNINTSEIMLQIAQQLLTPKSNKEVVGKLNNDIGQFLDNNSDQVKNLKLSSLIYNVETPKKHENVPFDHKNSENLPKQLTKANFNSTFDKEVMVDRNIFLNTTFDRIESIDNAKLGLEAKKLSENTFLQEPAPVNTTFGLDEIISSNDNLMHNLDRTFEKDAINENLDGTFEVVGNGKFVIEGKITNLIDMESSALQTVLHCTPISTEGETPINRRKSLTSVKKKPSFMNRLSLAAVFTPAENGDSVVTAEVSKHEGVEWGADLDSKEQQTQPSQDSNPILQLKGPFGREEILNKLQKNTKLVAGSTGPVKAVPLKVFNAVERLGGRSVRAISTPVAASHQTGESVLSENNERKFPSLPSFGSVSSIDAYDAVSDGSGTPEVFRFRSGKEPTITSTPAMKAEIKFSMIPGSLCGNNVPTPIVAPKDQSSFPYGQGSRVMPITARNINHEKDFLEKEPCSNSEDGNKDKSFIVNNSKVHLPNGNLLHHNKETGIQILRSNIIEDTDNEVKNLGELLKHSKETASMATLDCNEVAEDIYKIPINGVPKSELQDINSEEISGDKNGFDLGQNLNEATFINNPENCFTVLQHIDKEYDIHPGPNSEVKIELTNCKMDLTVDIAHDDCKFVHDAHTFKTNVTCKPIAEEPTSELKNDSNEHTVNVVNHQEEANIANIFLHNSHTLKEDACELVANEVAQTACAKTSNNSESNDINGDKFSKNKEGVRPVKTNVEGGKLSSVRKPISVLAGARRSSLNNNKTSKTGASTNLNAPKLVSVQKPSMYGQQFKAKELSTKPPLNAQSKIVPSSKNKQLPSTNFKSCNVNTTKVEEKGAISRRSINEPGLHSNLTHASLKPTPLGSKPSSIQNLTKQPTNVPSDAVLGSKAGSQLLKRPSGLKPPSKLAVPLSSNLAVRRSSLQFCAKPFTPVNGLNTEKEQNSRKIAASCKENVQPIAKYKPRCSQTVSTNIPRPSFR